MRLRATLMAPLILTLACHEPSTTPEDGVSRIEQPLTLTPEEQRIDQVLKDPDIVPSPDGSFYTADQKKTEYETKWDGQKYLLCQNSLYSAKASTSDLVALDPNVGVLYPGALVHGIDANSGTLTPILLPRRGGTVALDDTVFISGTNPTKSATIDEFRASKVSDAIASVLLKNQVNTAARSRIFIEKASSFEEAMLKVGLDVQKAKFKFQGSFQTKSWTNKTSLIVKFVQVYYTAYPELGYPAQVFATDVTAEDVAAVTNAADPILMVSGVSYGRTLMMRITSAASENHVKAAFNAAYSGTVDASVQLTAEQRTILSEAEIETYALGGSSATGMQVLSGPEQLQAYLKEGASWSPSSPGVPISYTLRALKSGKAFAAKYASDFVVPSCSAGKDKEVVQVTFERFHFQDSGDGAGKGDLTYSVHVGLAAGPNENEQILLSYDGPGRTKVGDGDDLHVNWTPSPIEITRDKRFFVRFRVTDWNKKVFGSWKEDETAESAVYYHWDAASKAWVRESDPKAEHRNLKFDAHIKIDRLNPCVVGEHWDVEKDLCIPPNVTL